MHKRMESVDVYINDAKDRVCLKQDDYGDGENVVMVSPEQVDTVIAWLKEARDRLLGDQK